MRNKEINLLKALGIIAVVMGHSSWRIGGAFDSYSFHMALFIFASGYFYKISNEDNIPLFLLKKFKQMVIPYYLYNIFYWVLTVILFRYFNLNFGYGVTLRNFLIQPFTDGHHNLLYSPAWFVLHLMIIQIVFLFLYRFLRNICNNFYINLFIFLILGVTGVSLSINVPNYNIVVIRTLFGLFFFYLGFFYRNILEGKNIFKSSTLFLIIFFQIILSRNFPITYELVWGNFHGGYLIPFLTSINGIYLYLFIAKSLAKILPDKDILYKIGDNSFHIMANHLLVFLVLNMFFISYFNLDYMLLQNIWFKFEIDKYWFVYVSTAIVVPTYVAILLQKLILCIKNYCGKFITVPQYNFNNSFFDKLSS